jgi:PKD repeat protein
MWQLKISRMFKKALFIGIGTALLAVPFVSSATTLSDLQAQLQSLLSQIQALQSQSSTSISGTATPSCPSLSRSLSIGVSGGDVTALQQFLSTQGDFSVTPTGYFGTLTKAAVGRWQAQNDIAASGSAGSGIFGPLSRAFLVRSCGGSTTGTNFYVSPASGAAPLSVQFTSSAPQGSTIGSTVNFGDGTSGALGFAPVCSSCNALGTVSHTYTSAGTYTATLTSGTCSCPAGGICNCPNMQILGTATVTVNSGGTVSGIQQLNAPGSVSLQPGGIAEIRNESFYFTLQSLSPSSATIQITSVGCWNSFPSDPPPQIRCMIAVVPIPPQTLAVGQTYSAANYAVTLVQINNGVATFSVNASSVVQ